MTPPAEGSGGRVYLLRDGKVWPVSRDAPLAGDAADESSRSSFSGRATRSSSSA